MSEECVTPSQDEIGRLWDWAERAEARVKELEEENERLRLELEDALWNEPVTSGLRGEERLLDVPAPSGGENSPLEREEER
jgi:hypothetical protein